VISFLRHAIGCWIMGFFRSRQDLILENLALGQQLLALNAKRPRRRLSTVHRLFWIALRRVWSRLETTARARYPENRGGVASRGLSPVLATAVASQTGRPETGEPRGPGLDLSYGR